jgi:hypothetical protein
MTVMQIVQVCPGMPGYTMLRLMLDDASPAGTSQTGAGKGSRSLRAWPWPKRHAHAHGHGHK